MGTDLIDYLYTTNVRADIHQLDEIPDFGNSSSVVVFV